MLNEVLQAFQEDAPVKVDGHVAASRGVAQATSITHVELAAAPA
jgi:hypothetical protein